MVRQQKLLLTFLIIILYLQYTKARVISHTISISNFRNQNGWYYLDRMTLSKGSVTIDIKGSLTQIQAPTNQSFYLVIALFLDFNWETQKSLKCSRHSIFHSLNSSQVVFPYRYQHDSYNIPLIFENSQLEAKKGFNFMAQKSGYHIVLKDCQKLLIDAKFSKDSIINLQIQLKSDENQYGDQQSPFLIWYPIFVILNLLMLKFSSNLRDGIDNQIDWVRLLLHIGLWFNLGAIFIKSISFFIYIFITGRQYGIADFLYLAFHSISESIIISILIFVAFGWTVTFINNKDMDLYVPLMAMLGLINIILTLLCKINDQDHNKYHMYDSIPAYILIFFRVVAFLIFILGLGIVFYKYNQKPAVMKFYKLFAALGLIYFCSLPILMWISTFLALSLRQTFVFLTVQFVKNFINIILTFELTSKKGGYAGIKYKNASFMEENGKLL